jgi:hypothetical protein
MGDFESPTLLAAVKWNSPQTTGNNVAVCRCRHGHLKIQNNPGLSAATLGLKS